MLLRRAQLDAIRDGRITLQFRRWRRPTVKAGGSLRTAIGVLAIERVDVVTVESITAADAVAAGCDSLEDLRAHLSSVSEGDVYRVALRFAGVDPRLALRAQSTLSATELLSLQTKLARLDANARRGEWTWATLTAIRANPGTYSGVLADQVGVERLWLKAQIRKLKELGLTESLEVGYRLSPRGEALLHAVSLRAPNPE